MFFKTVQGNRIRVKKERKLARNLEKTVIQSKAKPPISWGTGDMLLPPIVALKVFLKKSMGRDIPGTWSQKERNICLGFGNFRKLFPSANKSVRNNSTKHVTEAAKKYGRVEKKVPHNDKKTAGDYLKISPKPASCLLATAHR